MNNVFPNLRNQFTGHNWLKRHALVAPTNVAVDDLNIKLLEQLPGEHDIYNFIDAVLNTDEAVNYPVEFLNNLAPPGLPSHNVHLKNRTLITLVRSFDRQSFEMTQDL
uniref:Uncharacterized protein n=1 Tax=Octopus bimaculoides TaxID=37653 RepID=A0A0L8GQJ6_OCTBM